MLTLMITLMFASLGVLTTTVGSCHDHRYSNVQGTSTGTGTRKPQLRPLMTKPRPAPQPILSPSVALTLTLIGICLWRHTLVEL